MPVLQIRQNDLVENSAQQTKVIVDLRSIRERHFPASPMIDS
jgi:hypothetical protein